MLFEFIDKLKTDTNNHYHATLVGFSQFVIHTLNETGQLQTGSMMVLTNNDNGLSKANQIIRKALDFPPYVYAVLLDMSILSDIPYIHFTDKFGDPDLLIPNGMRLIFRGVKNNRTLIVNLKNKNSLFQVFSPTAFIIKTYEIRELGEALHKLNACLWEFFEFQEQEKSWEKQSYIDYTINTVSRAIINNQLLLNLKSSFRFNNCLLLNNELSKKFEIDRLWLYYYCIEKGLHKAYPSVYDILTSLTRFKAESLGLDVRDLDRVTLNSIRTDESDAIFAMNFINISFSRAKNLLPAENFLKYNNIDEMERLVKTELYLNFFHTKPIYLFS